MVVAPQYDSSITTIVGAWGFRRLISSYSGSLCRVRDSNDDSEQDVGMDGDGNLASFSVVGDAYVVKIYDQSGNAAHIGQTSSSLQPKLILNGTPLGKPAALFDGVDDYLKDPTAATNRPYQITNPLWFVSLGLTSTFENFGSLIGIPHVGGSSTSPFFRINVSHQGTDAKNFQLRFNSSNYDTEFISGLNGPSWLSFAIDAKNRKIYPGIRDVRPTDKSGDAANVTYPNATGLYIGGNGAGAANCGMYFAELVIGGDASPVVADVQDLAVALQAYLFTGTGFGWRMKINTNFDTGSDLRERMAEWMWALTSGGSNETTSTTQIFASSFNSNSDKPYNLTDGSNSTTWLSTNTSAPHYVGVLFPVRKDFAELKFVSASANLTWTPKTFDVEYIDEDGEWQTLQSVDLTSQGTGINKTYTIALGALPVDNINQDLDMSWRIFNTVTKELTVSWEIERIIVRSDFDVSWRINLYDTLKVIWSFENAKPITYFDYRAIYGSDDDNEVEQEYDNSSSVMGSPRIMGAIDVSPPDHVILDPLSIFPVLNFYGDFYLRIWMDPLLLRLSNPRINSPIAYHVWSAYPTANQLTAIGPATVGVEFLDPLPVAFDDYEYKTLYLKLTEDAPPELDVTFDLTFDMGASQLHLIATVIKALELLPNEPVRESWSWNTVINRAKQGNEFRASRRTGPRYSINYEVQLTDDLLRMTQYSQFWGYTARTLRVPFYQYKTEIVAPSTVGGNRLYFDPAVTDVREDEYLVLFNPQTETLELIKVVTIETDGVTIEGTLQFNVPVGWWVIPTVEMRLTGTPSINMGAVEGTSPLQAISVNYRSLVPDTADATIETYDDYPVISARPIADDQLAETFDQNAETIEDGVASTTINTFWGTPTVSGVRRWLIDDRTTEINYWRQFAQGLLGSLKPFLIPTWRDDLDLAEPLSPGSSSIIVNNPLLADQVEFNPFSRIQIETAAGIMWRRISSVQSIGSGQFQVNLNETMDADPLVADVKKVSFLNLFRLANDEVRLYHYVNYTIVEMSVVTVLE